MTDLLQQMDAFTTPGSLLRRAREVRGMDEQEVTDRLNWMPGYVRIIEADDYSALRRPTFARGYVRAYGKLLGVDEKELLAAFDQLHDEQEREAKRVTTRSLQLQHTGIGVVVGLLVLLLLVLALWWWQGSGADMFAAEVATAEAPAAEFGPDGVR